MARVVPQSSAFPALLTTNLIVPPLHGEIIARDGLVNRLDEALRFPITLVTAPAGFGKTTLLCQWIAGRKKQLRERAAWISLESECDLRQFWAYLAAGLGGLHAGIREMALALLEPAQPAVHAVVKTLINQVSAAGEDFVLILDDYHAVDDPAVHGTLTYFANHLPANLHLVIASRSEPPLPLARWRANHRLHELREADLRFSPAETAAFINEMKGLDLSPEEVSALETRTEGWIAGLQLAALSLQGSDAAAKRAFVSAFAGSQRYIMDYLVEEVLQRQPERVMAFLLQTSMLERLNASLCDAVTGQAGGQAVLERLERAHLFTIPLDHERRWYRYHHLFRDVLRYRLSQADPESVRLLHRRAAEWYARAGRTDDAIRHACAAQEWDRAVELIETVISAAWNRGEVRKISEWFGKLPAEHLDARIHLSLYFSRALMLGGQMEAAGRRLREAETRLRARLARRSNAEDRLQLGAVCAFRTTIAAIAGETASAAALGREALSLLPPEAVDIRAHALNSLGGNHYHLGDMREAGRACAEAGRLAQQAGNLYLVMVAASYQARALACQGRLRQAGQVLEEALKLDGSASRPAQARVPAASVACASYGSLLYEWNRLEEAERFLAEAVELGQQLAYGSALWSACQGLARIRLAQGDRNGASQMIEQAQRYRLEFGAPLPVRLLDAEQTRADLAMGRLDAAGRWARACEMDRPPSPGFIDAFEKITLARFYLLQDRPGRALDLLNPLYAAADAGGQAGLAIEILALTALAHQARGGTQEAGAALRASLRLAEPEGYLRIFVDEGRPMAALLYQALAQGDLPGYAGRLLAAFAAGAPAAGSAPDPAGAPRAAPAQASLVEPLSQRELEVLHLMAAGASNVDIAAELVIALTTAKKHVSNIIQKLGVENRTQAVAKGRSLGLFQ